MNIEFLQHSNVARLNICEPAVVETNTINDLKKQLGIVPGRDVVERAAFELSDRLNRVEVALMDGDLETTEKIARGMIGVSEQIGLRVFASVAKDLVHALQRKDFVAIAAISRRLNRQGETALFQVVDFSDDPKCS